MHFTLETADSQSAMAEVSQLLRFSYYYQDILMRVGVEMFTTTNGASAP